METVSGVDCPDAHPPGQGWLATTVNGPVPEKVICAVLLSGPVVTIVEPVGVIVHWIGTPGVFVVTVYICVLPGQTGEGPVITDKIGSGATVTNMVDDALQ